MALASASSKAEKCLFRLPVKKGIAFRDVSEEILGREGEGPVWWKLTPRAASE